ncbi:hypothetical protein ABPG74_000695 [Tetrahymena malaccensis]
MTVEKNKNSDCFKVAVRCRPLSNIEIQDGRDSVVSVNSQRGEILIKPNNDPAERLIIFTFDEVLGPDTQQDTVYQSIAYPIVESALEGYNGTIFAYGQTGTGKTHTIQGKNDPICERGIIPRSFEHIFRSIKGTSNTQFLVYASFIEIYNEEIRDLLSNNSKHLQLREKPETGVFVKDLTSFLVQNEQELNNKFMQGIQNRIVGQTKMSSCSSRSHSIFSVTIEKCEVLNGESHVKVGKLNLVDLAGSERQSKTQATGSRLKEAVHINLSLSTLGNVISSLVDPKATYIPYRDSKLTRILQDSLGGNTKTAMIANIGPADYNCDETISTLRYAHRAKSIQNHAQINEDPKQALIKKFQDEISSLKQQLSGLLESGGDVNLKGEVTQIEKIVIKYDDKEIEQLKKKLEQQKYNIESNYENEVKKIEEDKQLQEKERQQLIQQLQENEQKQQQQKQQQQKLIDKLYKMQHKVIQGEEKMKRVLENERQLNKEMQLANERSRQTALQIQQNEDFMLEMNQKYRNQFEEKLEKQKKIDILFLRLQQIQSQNQDLDEFYISEIDQLQEGYRNLQKEIKFKKFILDYFIPKKELKRLSEKAVYSEEQQNWVYPIQNLTGKYIRKPNQSQVSLNESEELEQDQNLYFVYTEEGPIREQFFYTEEIRKHSQDQRTNRNFNKNDSQAKSQELLSVFNLIDINTLFGILAVQILRVAVADFCSSGYYDPNSQICTTCQDNYSSTQVSNTDSSSCFSYPENQTPSSGNTCSPCPDNFYSQCGQYCISYPSVAFQVISVECQNCPNGQYGQNSVCYVCPQNTSSKQPENLSLSSCFPCPQNQSSSFGGDCINCHNNFYSVKGGNCIPCPSNQQSIGGQSCTKCPAGQSSSSGNGCSSQFSQIITNPQTYILLIATILFYYV